MRVYNAKLNYSIVRKRIYLSKSGKDSFAKLIYESVIRPTYKIYEILSKKVKKIAGYIGIRCITH